MNTKNDNLQFWSHLQSLGVAAAVKIEDFKIGPKENCCQTCQVDASYQPKDWRNVYIRSVYYAQLLNGKNEMLKFIENVRRAQIDYGDAYNGPDAEKFLNEMTSN